jgi:hypothetical protein
MHPSLVDRSYIALVHDAVMTAGADGVTSLDAHIAACVGSAILRVDRAATVGDTLVEYMTDSHPYDALATCNASSNGTTAVYHLYVPRLWSKMQAIGRLYTTPGDVLPATVIAALAAHEVRHRLQRQLGSRLRPFAVRRHKRRSDSLLNIIATVNRGTFLAVRRHMRSVGTDPAYIRVATGALEFDACVVEHLAVRRLGPRASADELAALVNLNDEP